MACFTYFLAHLIVMDGEKQARHVVLAVAVVALHQVFGVGPEILHVLGLRQVVRSAKRRLAGKPFEIHEIPVVLRSRGPRRIEPQRHHDMHPVALPRPHGAIDVRPVIRMPPMLRRPFFDHLPFDQRKIDPANPRFLRHGIDQPPVARP